MKDNLNWKNSIELIKKGDINGLQTIYILTYQQVANSIYQLTGTEESVYLLLPSIYKRVQEEVTHLADEEITLEWILLITESCITQFQNSQSNKLRTRRSKKRKKRNNNIHDNFQITEEKAAAIFISLEEEINILDENEVSRTSLTAKIIMTGSLVCISLFFLFKVYKITETSSDEKSLEVIQMVMTETSQESNIVPLDLESEEDINEKDIHDNEQQLEETFHIVGWSISEESKISYYDEEGKKMIGSHKIDGYEFEFDDLGDLVNFHNENYNRYEIGEWIYYLEKENNNNQYTLYRVSKSESEKTWKEVIFKNIESYYIIEDDLIYLASDVINIVKNVSDQKFTKVEQELHLVSRDDGFYLANEQDSIVFNELKDSHLQMEDRIYRIKEGRIKYVKPNILPIKGVSYYINSDDSFLYWKNTKGEGGRFVGEGLGINSFCIVDKWVYYSVYTRSEDNKRYSQIRRISVDGLVRENVSNEFKGNFTNMYYYQEKGQIYAEFLPDKSQYGKIAVMSLNGSGEISVIEDSEQRNGEQTTGEDMLELIMIDGNQIYCYWHNCDWKNRNGVQILWTKPIILSDQNRTTLEP